MLFDTINYCHYLKQVIIKGIFEQATDINY